MKKNLLLSFLALVVTQVLIRLQGVRLVTPQSSRGIIDLELARTPERLMQLRLFWNSTDVNQNILLDFLFIAAAVWFLISLARWVEGMRKRLKLGRLIRVLAFSVALSDSMENILMLTTWNGRSEPSVIGIVYYCSLIKFIFTILLLLVVLPTLFLFFTRPKPVTGNNADSKP
jgi:hypothetical protein